MNDHKSQSKLKFSTAGVLVSREDRDANKTLVNDTGAGPGSFRNVSVVAPAGPTTARTVTVVTDAANKTTLTHTANTDSRTVAFTSTVGSKKTMTKFTDALGRDTVFGYDTAARLTSVSAPESVTTGFGYDTSNRVTSITQTETATGGPGTSVTRLAYPSAMQTLLADPSTDQGLAVATVPHTTYTINAGQRVDAATNAENRATSKTYTANFDEASTASGAAGTYQSTTSKAYGANTGESLTKATSGEGAAFSASYANPSGPAQYSATGSTDDAGNSSLYTYNGTGNALSSADALAAKASLDVNVDGTVASATAPNHSGDSPVSDLDKTRYSYTNAQMSQVTPKAGTSLGVRNMTYDVFGRLKTATNGRGVTATYGYDKLDRMTSTGFSDGSVVTYDYDLAGRQDRRADNAGTTTSDYDQLGRLVSRQNSAGGGTFTYSYNKASWLTQSTSPAGGTITYAYDKAGVPASISYPYNATTATMRFAVDSHNRRNHTWLGANADHTTWAAHYQLDYDKSDRVLRVRAFQGTGDANNTAVIDINYCYKALTTNHACTGDATTDRSKLQWKKDNLSGQTIDYTYTKSGRLADAVVSNTADSNYTYDKNGNRTGNAGTNLTFNDENQITTAGFTYDGAGNLTQNDKLSAITYTAADQLKTVVKAGATYTYTHAGADQNELLSETTPQGTYNLAYGRTDQRGKPVIEQASKDGATASVVSDPVTGQPLMLRTSSGMQSMYVYDGTPGNPIALITSGSYQAFAYSYDPYGVPTLTQSSGGLGVDQNPYLFAGGVQDRTTGWIHFGNRYYDPTTGTWTQLDTLDTPLDPANANRYAYAGGDPINVVDPTGRYGIKDYADTIGTFAAGGAGVGAIAGCIITAAAGCVGGAGVGAAIGGVAGASVGVGYGIGEWQYS